MPNLLSAIYKENNFASEDRLSESNEYCKSVTKDYAKSFYFASQFLPKSKRMATYILYGFCRYTDNIVDENEELSSSKKQELLDSWKGKLRLALKFGYSDHPILHSFTHLLKEYPINPQHAFDLIEGVEMDLKKSRYSNYAELQNYSYKVASVVGLMMSEILGYNSKDALPYAVKLGEAMQITNILRDIKEDYHVDRIYLPQDLMDSFNVTEADIAKGNNSAGFKRLVEHLASMADELYKQADIGIKMLDPRSRFSIIAASKSYQGIQTRIRKAHYDVFKKRQHVSLFSKISMMFIEYLKTPFRR